MDPKTLSLLTTIVGYAATAVATYAANKGVIPGGDQTALANQITLLVSGGVAAAIGFYKLQQHTPTAQIAAVNAADNGVKVVAESAPAPQVNAPLK